jgi:hypothetical protein
MYSWLKSLNYIPPQTVSQTSNSSLIDSLVPNNENGSEETPLLGNTQERCVDLYTFVVLIDCIFLQFFFADYSSFFCCTSKRNIFCHFEKRNLIHNTAERSLRKRGLNSNITKRGLNCNITKRGLNSYITERGINYNITKRGFNSNIAKGVVNTNITKGALNANITTRDIITNITITIEKRTINPYTTKGVICGISASIGTSDRNNSDHCGGV